MLTSKPGPALSRLLIALSYPFWNGLRTFESEPHTLELGQDRRVKVRLDTTVLAKIRDSDPISTRKWYQLDTSCNLTFGRLPHPCARENCSLLQDHHGSFQVEILLQRNFVFYERLTYCVLYFVVRYPLRKATSLTGPQDPGSQAQIDQPFILQCTLHSGQNPLA